MMSTSDRLWSDTRLTFLELLSNGYLIMNCLYDLDKIQKDPVCAGVELSPRARCSAPVAWRRAAAGLVPDRDWPL